MTMEMKDIIGNENFIFGHPLLQVLKFLLIFLAVFAVLLFLYFLYQFFKKNLKKSKKPIPADILALQLIDGLLKKDFLQKRKWRELYLELNEIAKNYLHHHLTVDCLEKTTEELIKNQVLFRKPVFLRQHWNELKEFWIRQQMAVFARHPVSPEAAQGDLVFIKTLILETQNKKNHDD